MDRKGKRLVPTVAQRLKRRAKARQIFRRQHVQSWAGVDAAGRREYLQFIRAEFGQQQEGK